MEKRKLKVFLYGPLRVVLVTESTIRYPPFSSSIHPIFFRFLRSSYNRGSGGSHTLHGGVVSYQAPPVVAEGYRP